MAEIFLHYEFLKLFTAELMDPNREDRFAGSTITPTITPEIAE